MIISWQKRIFRVQGHSISFERLYAVQWVLGVLGVFWALLVGVFIVLGGAEQLTAAVYKPLIETFHDYQMIGAVNILGGILGVVGLGFDLKRVSILSAGICAGWNGLLAFYTIPENWDDTPGNGNILGLYALLIMIMYLLRIVLLRSEPDVDTMKLR